MKRLVPLLLLAVALAGCGADDPEDGDPRDVTGPPATTSAGTMAPTPATFEGVRLTHDYASGATEETNFTIPPDAGELAFEVYFHGPQGSGTCVSPEGDPARIVIQSPTGQESQVEAAPLSTTTDSGRCPGGISSHGIRLTPGVWTITFAGRGVLTGVVSAQPL